MSDALVLDCLGWVCPRPVIELGRRFGEVPVGETVLVLADDVAAATDIPAWCRLRGQTYVGPAGRHGHRVRRVS